MWIIYWTLGWLAGIWSNTLWEFPAYVWALPIFAALIGLYILHGRSTWRIVLVIAIAFSLGAVRTSLAATSITNQHIASYHGRQPITFQGHVIKEPDRYDTQSRLLVEAGNIIDPGGQVQPVGGKVLVKTDPYPVIPYGANIMLTGKLDTPRNFYNFDYRAYLAQKDIFSLMNDPQITVIDVSGGNPLMRILLVVKARAQQAINLLFPEPQASLLSGILLGNDLGIPDDLMADFRATGTAHIIAISGFNIAIVAGILARGGRHIFSLRTAGLLAIISIGLYALLVGAEASVVRAAIMAGLLITAVHFLGRPTFVPAAIFTAAFAMTLVNPRIITDIGFQLSFMATLGLTLYVGPWSNFLRGRLDPYLGSSLSSQVTRLLADVFLATLSALLMTFPLLLYHFGKWPIISPLANFIILPAQPGIMIWGGLATVAGMLSPLIAQPIAWIAWLFLAYTTYFVQFFADLDMMPLYASISPWVIIAYYGLIFGITYLSSTEKNKVPEFLQKRWIKWGAAGVALFLVFSFLFIRSRPDGNLHIHFLDVGQGDATYIQLPGGEQILVDGGAETSVTLDQLGRQMPFWDKSLDLVVATHPDIDHVGGLVGVMERYQVGTLLTNGQQPEGASAYHALLNQAQRSATPIHQVQAGETINFAEGAVLEILHPQGNPSAAGDNDSSVSMRLVYDNFSLLLTGDAEQGAEQAMLANNNSLAAAVFKAGHHGSNSSSSRLFLQAVEPQIVVISAGQDNLYGHPHPEVLERSAAIGATILRTDEMGTIEIISDGNQIWHNVEVKNGLP